MITNAMKTLIIFVALTFAIAEAAKPITPTLMKTPVDLIVAVDTIVTLTCKTASTGTMTYKFQVGGIEVSGSATAAIYKYPSKKAGTFEVTCTAINAGTTKSDKSEAQSFKVAVDPKKATLTKTPADAFVAVGTKVTLTCATTTPGTMTYKFYEASSSSTPGTGSVGNTLVITATNAVKPIFAWTCTATDKDKIVSAKSEPQSFTVMGGGNCPNIQCQNKQLCDRVKSIEGKVDFKCICKGPFSGSFCEKGPCDKVSCANKATCKADFPKEENSKASCDCKKGPTDKTKWQGRTCNVQNQGNCRYVTCRNGGLCSVTTSVDGFKCTCEPDWEGPFCRIAKTVLTSKPNRKTFVKGEKVTFNCRTKETGVIVFTLKKNNNPAFDTATVTATAARHSDFTTETLNTLGTFVYSCRTKVAGRTFDSAETVIIVNEKRAGQCSIIKCAHGGRCMVVNGEPTCKCIGKYEGMFCQTVKSAMQCTQVTCQNQKKACTNDINGFKCHCLHGYYGIYCEKTAPELNGQCKTLDDCEGLTCPAAQKGYCDVVDFKCKCQADYGEIICTSHNDCHNNCPTGIGLCMAEQTCICFKNAPQLFFFEIAYKYPNGPRFLKF